MGKARTRVRKANDRLGGDRSCLARSASTRETNGGSREILLGRQTLGCNVKGRRVTLKNNKADLLSRGFLSNDLHWCNEVVIEIPLDLRFIVSQVVPKEENEQLASSFKAFKNNTQGVDISEVDEIQKHYL